MAIGEIAAEIMHVFLYVNTKETGAQRNNHTISRCQEGDNGK